jgi:hypothetical protein
VLIAMGRDRRALLASYQYLIMGTIGATFYVIGVGLIYLVTGSLNIVDIAGRLGPATADQFRPAMAALAFLTVGMLADEKRTGDVDVHGAAPLRLVHLRQRLRGVIAAALLETTCRPPKAWTVAATAPATAALSFTSQPIASARPPDASIRAATAPAPSASMSAHATQAPSAAKHSAIALPIPLADPAMNATLPSSFSLRPPYASMYCANSVRGRP